MKLTIYLLFVLLFLSCHFEKEVNKDAVLGNLTTEEIEWIKELLKQKAKFDNYDKTEKSLLGLKNLDELQLKEGEFAYQFELRAEYDEYLELFEIIDKNQTAFIDVKTIKYNIKRECNPVIGNKKMTKDCIRIVEKNIVKIDRKTMKALNELFLQNGFWEFTENESEIRKYDDLLYHGESWSIKGAFAIDYPTNNGMDTTIVFTQKVNRMIPEDFKRFQEIGNRIKLIVSEGYLESK